MAAAAVSLGRGLAALATVARLLRGLYRKTLASICRLTGPPGATAASSCRDHAVRQLSNAEKRDEARPKENWPRAHPGRHAFRCCAEKGPFSSSLTLLIGLQIPLAASSEFCKLG